MNYTDEHGLERTQEVVDPNWVSDDSGYWWTNDDNQLETGLMVGAVQYDADGTKWTCVTDASYYDHYDHDINHIGYDYSWDDQSWWPDFSTTSWSWTPDTGSSTPGSTAQTEPTVSAVTHIAAEHHEEPATEDDSNIHWDIGAVTEQDSEDLDNNGIRGLSLIHI